MEVVIYTPFSQQLTPDNKPLIGISCGDLNGTRTELIIKTFSDNRVYKPVEKRDD